MYVFGKTHRPPVDLDPVLINQVVVGRIGARETDHLPCDHVAVAAIDRVAEKTLERGLPKMREEHIGRYAAKILSARLERLEIAILLLRAHSRKRGSSRAPC